MNRRSGIRALAARSGFGGLPRLFWRLWGAALINRLGTFVVPFLALFLDGERGLGSGQAGFVVAGFGAGALAAGPLGGLLADRLGRRQTIALGMTLGAASLGGLLAAHGLGWLMVASLVLGLAHELPRPAMSAMVADLVPAADRPRAYGALYWAANLGFALASVLAGLATLVSFTWLFVIDGATSLACGALVLLTLPESAARPAPDAPARSIWSDVAVPFRDPVFLRFFAVSLVVALVFFQFHVAMPLDMRAHGIRTSTYGALVAINGGLIVVLQPFAGALVARATRAHLLSTAALLNGLGFGLLGLGSSVALYATAIVVLTLGEILMAPINPVVVSELAPASLRGAYQGGFSVAMSLAACLAPILGTAVLEQLGGRALWGGCFALGLLAAAWHRAAAGSGSGIGHQAERAPLAASVPVEAGAARI